MSNVNLDKNITEIEIPFLPQDYNLTDGHAYRSWSQEELEIINKTSEIFRTVNRQMQPQIESEYIKDFLTLGKQTIDFENQRYLMCANASMGLEIIANILRLRKLTLALVEPCFDNLADIFKRHNIPLTPFSDEYYDKPTDEFEHYLNSYEVDAFCLVSPNNPTGNTLTRENFICLIEFCKRNNKLLVLDFCFRFYLPDQFVYDQYELLRDSGVKYIVVEDTGKTWPTVELKGPFITVSNEIFEEVYQVYTDMILHVSPVTLKLVNEFIKLSLKDNLGHIHNVVNKNREALYKSIQGTFLTPAEKPFASIAWLQVHHMTGKECKELFDKFGVHVLPGNYFYWSDHHKGRNFIRVALVRDINQFERAASVISTICRNHMNDNFLFS